MQRYANNCNFAHHMPKTLLFIINPHSGTDSKKAMPELIEQTFQGTDFIADVRFTEYAGHAEELAREAATRGVEACIAVGGDGTVNEVARACRHTDTALGVVPCGSGNGLARHLGIPLTAPEALEVVKQWNVEPFDYGTINDHPFFCTAGVGFDAYISERFAKANRRGLLTYIETMVRNGFAYQPARYTVYIDGKREELSAFLITAGNASQYGNDVYITPHASMKDGLLDVTIIEPFPTIQAPYMATQLLTRTIERNQHTRSVRCKRLRIERPEDGYIHADGEPIMTDRTVDIEIREKGIKVVTPLKPQRSLITQLIDILPDVFS